jgi:hypothetical protein
MLVIATAVEQRTFAILVILQGEPQGFIIESVDVL